MKIRAATIQDIEALRVFEQGVIKAERPYDETLQVDPIEYYDLESLIVANDTQIVVVELNQAIIACGYARIKQAKKYANYNFYSYLGFMFVQEEYRGKGLNHRVIDALTQWSLEQGVTMMHLDVYTENASAIRAYQKVGFKEYLVEMRMDISQK
ncbi:MULTISPECIES: GNAT family N-acetyltransferase [Thalassotalea]|uniref:GNAT family N-acetyltransferase n=1 Tax=Thalassotalea castellviae TaxID=3075612 RepID=A0ABU2ZYC1_9GAMM|nr:GNAT family N-acetyltransferase [Thalassotalea sp. W431]MDT0602920.1 GNAT family N-acetyltransferase [Thalassotalea sp. W431]